MEADEFYDDEPGPPKAMEGIQQAQAEARRPPYTITVSTQLIGRIALANRSFLFSISSVQSRSKGWAPSLGGRMLESRLWTRVESSVKWAALEFSKLKRKRVCSCII